MTALIVTAPILPGKVERWRRLCQEMDGRRRAGYRESRRRLGIAREAAWLLQTPRSELAVICLEADEPEEIVQRLAVSDHPFDRWFRAQLAEILGLDLANLFQGARAELIFDEIQER